ncbi:MAG: DUF4266 domain-containing protein [Fibrobacteria bacterium]|nr:DUF4266 domain-containing protein [Fibrobacteria bacterium]
MIINVILIFLTLLFANCAVVQPWQREKLSDPIMIMDENPVRKSHSDSHHERREGSSGGTGEQSGGCGCG